MVYPVRIAPYVVYTMHGDKEPHQTSETLEIIKKTLDSNGDRPSVLLFGEYEPVFDRSIGDPCRFNTIDHTNVSHRLVGCYETNSEIPYGEIEFIPSPFGEIAKTWYHRDPNHLILVPRVLLNSSHEIKLLITVDLKVNRG